MKSLLFFFAAFISGVIPTAAYSAPGEYWEVTTKMEMQGMPFAMPATTMKVCIPKGSEKDPKYMQGKDSNCQMTDVSHSGNTTRWKATCVNRGETMYGVGEATQESDSSHGSMHMTGKTEGRAMDMTMTYKNKRIGGSCDTEEMANKIKGEICDTAKFDTRDWISRAEMFLKNNTCPGKKEPLCDAVRRDAPRDADIYQYLVTTESNNGGFIARSCGLNMEAVTKSVCKTLNGKNLHTLSAYCPAEAKSYRAAARKTECEGRSYTAHEDLSKCLNGQEGDDSGEGVAADEPQPRSGMGKSRSGAANPAESVLEGAKKLKGLFGF